MAEEQDTMEDPRVRAAEERLELIADATGVDGGEEVLQILEQNLDMDVFTLEKDPDAAYAQMEQLEQALVADALSNLDRVFLPDDIIDTVVERMSIPELVHDEHPNFGGLILYGPAGTGKSELLEALERTWEDMGAATRHINLGQVMERYVGAGGNNLEQIFIDGVTESKAKSMPTLFTIDEGTTVLYGSDGVNDADHYYEEIIDTLKKWTGGKYRDNVTIVITTNAKNDKFAEPLVRPGRITALEIPPPGDEQKRDMWKYFLAEHSVIDGLSEDQYMELAQMIPADRGAFIEEFTRSYVSNRKQAIARSRGHKNSLEALKAGVRVTDAEAHEGITFESLVKDLESVAGEKPFEYDPSGLYA